MVCQFLFSACVSSESKVVIRHSALDYQIPGSTGLARMIEILNHAPFRGHIQLLRWKSNGGRSKASDDTLPAASLAHPRRVLVTCRKSVTVWRRRDHPAESQRLCGGPGYRVVVTPMLSFAWGAIETVNEVLVSGTLKEVIVGGCIRGSKRNRGDGTPACGNIAGGVFGPRVKGPGASAGTGEAGRSWERPSSGTCRRRG
jgi:hypothetical protein